MGGDSVPYSAVTDTGGSFALAGLPTGDYWAFAFQDQNRNRTLEREFEPHDSSRVNLSDSALVAELELWLTAPDSTAPLLALAQARDSLTTICWSRTCRSPMPRSAYPTPLRARSGP